MELCPGLFNSVILFKAFLIDDYPPFAWTLSEKFFFEVVSIVSFYN